MWDTKKQEKKKKKKKKKSVRYHDASFKKGNFTTTTDNNDTSPPPQAPTTTTIIKQNNNKNSSFIIDARPQTEEARERCRNMNRHIQNFFKSTKKAKKRTFLAYDERMLNHKPPVARRHPEVPERVAMIWKSLEKYVDQCEIIKTSTSTYLTFEYHTRTNITTHRHSHHSREHVEMS